MILIVDCGSTKVPDIERMVDEFMDFETISMYDFPDKDLTDIKGIVISGAPILITEVNPEPYLEAFKKIKEIEIPVFGICFGHQIIGLLYGAYASRTKDDRDLQTISFYEESAFLKSLPEEVEMMEDHCEAISIPPGFKLLGGSDVCINEAMQHNEKPIFGVQFHPEVSGNMGARLFDNFIQICSR